MRPDAPLSLARAEGFPEPSLSADEDRLRQPCREREFGRHSTAASPGFAGVPPSQSQCSFSSNPTRVSRGAGGGREAEESEGVSARLTEKPRIKCLDPGGKGLSHCPYSPQTDFSWGVTPPGRKPHYYLNFPKRREKKCNACCIYRGNYQYLSLLLSRFFCNFKYRDIFVRYILY